MKSPIVRHMALALAFTTAVSGGTSLASFEDSPSDVISANADAISAISEAGLNDSERRRNDMLMSAEKAKLEAETAKLIAEAQKLLSEARLNEARREQIYVEIERLKQRMRITEYEFQRIVAADYEMTTQIQRIERHANLVKPLFLGRANWKTWIGIDYLMMEAGDADIVLEVMFTIPVPELAASEFVANGAGSYVRDFPGGTLGDLYNHSRDGDVSFRRFGQAHKAIMKVLAMVEAAAENRIRELRDINQAIRLTIAKID